MFSKIDVNGENEAELYTTLKAAQPGDGENADVRWNFEKFLVDKSGNVVRRFGTAITPDQIAESLPEYL
jgi:glutathione peroxidase